MGQELRCGGPSFHLAVLVARMVQPGQKAALQKGSCSGLLTTQERCKVNTLLQRCEASLEIFDSSRQMRARTTSP